MLAKVIKPFAFFADGITQENLNVGDEREFGDMTSGLVKEGYVMLPGAAETRPSAPVVAGDDAAADKAPRRGRPRKT